MNRKWDMWNEKCVTFFLLYIFIIILWCTHVLPKIPIICFYHWDMPNIMVNHSMTFFVYIFKIFKISKCDVKWLYEIVIYFITTQTVSTPNLSITTILVKHINNNLWFDALIIQNPPKHFLTYLSTFEQ